MMSPLFLFTITDGAATRNFSHSVSLLDKETGYVIFAMVLIDILLIAIGWSYYRKMRGKLVQQAGEDRSSSSAQDCLTGLRSRQNFIETIDRILATRDDIDCPRPLAAPCASPCAPPCVSNVVAAKGSVEYCDQTSNRGVSYALLLCDIDCFRAVNDIHGQAVGDYALQDIAHRIRSMMPPSAIIARLSGDEFTVFFAYDSARPEYVDSIATHLVEILMAPIACQDVQLIVTASSGIAHSDSASITAEDMIRRAHVAMKKSRRQSRNSFKWYVSTMEANLEEQDDIETAMREGIEKGEFIPYFEPQVDIASGRLLGFEMLMRWQSADKGLLLPEYFIPIAESAGLIGELSMRVMRNAFDMARHWSPSLSIAVNISPHQIKDPWFSQKLMKLLLESGFPPSRLEVEITESSLFENMALVRSLIISLKNQGVTLSFDDFGTGYSALSHLRALPFDHIKIDESFTTTMRDNHNAAAVVVAILRLGESLNMPITAEGVVDEATARELLRLGCTKAQGGYYGCAASSADTRRLLAAKGLLPGVAMDFAQAV